MTLRALRSRRVVQPHRVDDTGEHAATPVDAFKRQLDVMQDSGAATSCWVYTYNRRSR